MFKIVHESRTVDGSKSKQSIFFPRKCWKLKPELGTDFGGVVIIFFFLKTVSVIVLQYRMLEVIIKHSYAAFVLSLLFGRLQKRRNIDTSKVKGPRTKSEKFIGIFTATPTYICGPSVYKKLIELFTEILMRICIFLKFPAFGEIRESGQVNIRKNDSIQL